jgi:predicted metalloprotease
MPTSTTTARRSFRRIVRLVLAAAAFVVAAPAADPAGAVNVPDRTTAGVVWYLGTPGYGGPDDMWRAYFGNLRRPYSTPSVNWYNRWNGDHYWASCDWTSNWVSNAFACGNGTIYMDKRHMEHLHATLGDYAVGGLLAHEWAHHVQNLLGYTDRTFRREYHADCLAGIYTRYGYANGRLSGGDYWEFHNWLMAQPPSSSHGIATERTAWYRYGWDNYSVGACDRVFG